LFKPTALSPAHYRIERVRGWLGTAAGVASMLSFYVGIALLLGIGTSWYMIEQGSRVSVTTRGSWHLWHSAGRVDADPYTRARFARQGSLASPADLMTTYEARRDEEGQRLHSSCDYVMDGVDVPGAWWSLTAFDERGQLIANPAERYSYSSATVALSADNTYLITVSRESRPGNWLPTSGAGRLVLIFSVAALQPVAKGGPPLGISQLPSIRRVSCR
jgi:hypothetical protein